VFGISNTVVTPPAAANEPLAGVLLYSIPGSRKWTCKSTKPGTCSERASTSCSAGPNPV